MHCSQVMQVQMSLSVAMFSTIPSIALSTIVLGAKLVSNLAMGHTVVHLPHSTQSNAPVSSMSCLTFATVCSFVRAARVLFFLLTGTGPSARSSSVNSLTAFANLVLSEALIHSVLMRLPSRPVRSRSLFRESTLSCAFLFPDT